MLAAVLATLSLCAGTAAPAGAAKWSEPVTLSQEGSAVFDVALGFDRRGRGIAAWGTRGGTALATRSVGGRWHPAGHAPDLGSRELAVDDAGRALLTGALDRGRSVYDDAPAASRGSVLGGFGPPFPLARGLRGHYTGAQVVLAGNRRGDAIVAWTRYPYSPEGAACERCDNVFARVRRAGGAFGPRVTIARRQDVVDLRVALNAHGRGVVAWSNIPQGTSPIRARLLSPSGRWGALEQLPDVLPDRSAFFDSPTGLTAAISPRGRVLLAWATIGFGEGDTSDYGLPVYASTRSLRSGFTPARALSPSSAVDSDGIARLDAAFTSGERALVAWTDGRTEQAQVHAAVFRGQALVGQRQLTHGAQDAQVADVTTAAGGRAVVMWSTRNAQSDYRQWEPTLLRASLFRDGRFGVARPVSPLTSRAPIGNAQIAFDRAGGKAVAIWIRYARGDSPASTILTASRSAE